MKTLCMDTSHRYLVLALVEDDQVVVSHMEEAWKKQSETIFVELIKLMEEANWNVDDINEVVITRGPGSYTGIRIAMSIAKVLCSRKNIKLSTISTLQLYAGLKDTYVMLDARSNRAYFGNYKNGVLIEECIKTLDEIEMISDKAIIGDTDLIGLNKEPIDFVTNFVALKDQYKIEENVHTVVPEYLKDESAYLGK